MIRSLKKIAGLGGTIVKRTSPAKIVALSSNLNFLKYHTTKAAVIQHHTPIFTAGLELSYFKFHIELVGGKDYSGRYKRDWLAHLKEDISIFGTAFEGWPKGCSEGWQMVSTSKGGSRVVHAELA